MDINKIFDNRAVLQGLKIYAKLNREYYRFKIVYVNEKGVKIDIPFKYDDLMCISQNSLECIIKNTILENSSNNDLPINRQASLCINKLKDANVIVDGLEFKLNRITQSGLIVEKFITYEELGESDSDFLVTIKSSIERNLVDNPPKPRKTKSYGSGFGITPYLFDSRSEELHFKELGPRRTVVSEAQLEKNRQIHKDEYEKNKENIEKFEKMEKELKLNKKSNTRDLARFR